MMATLLIPIIMGQTVQVAPMPDGIDEMEECYLQFEIPMFIKKRKSGYFKKADNIDIQRLGSPKNVIGDDEPIDEEEEEEKGVKTKEKIIQKKRPEIEIYPSSEMSMEEESVDYQDVETKKKGGGGGTILDFRKILENKKNDIQEQIKALVDNHEPHTIKVQRAESDLESNSDSEADDDMSDDIKPAIHITNFLSQKKLNMRKKSEMVLREDSQPKGILKQRKSYQCISFISL